MFANSSMTLEDFKTKIERRFSVSTNDSDIIDAYNDFASLVGREERKYFPSKNRSKTALLSVTSSGYNLALITDLGTTETGFRVYKDEIKIENYLRRTFPSSQEEGYYINGSVLYITPNNVSENIIIEYLTKTIRADYTDSITTINFEFDQDLEIAFEKYLMNSFYEGKYQFDLQARAEQVAFAEIQQFFGSNKTINTIKI